MSSSRCGRVLIVDDHADSTELVARIISTLGYDVACATSFGEAYELARSQCFDLLISDIALGDGSGVDLLAHIRALYPCRAIALTGHAMPTDVRRFANAGFDHVLVKPIGLGDLQSALRQVTPSTGHCAPLASTPPG